MKLRRGITAAVVLCLFVTANPARTRADDDASGSENRNELYLSYGVVTLQDFIILFESIAEDVTRSVLTAIIDREGGATYTRTTSGTRGAIAVGYNHYLTPRWTVGAILNYEGFTRTLNFSNGDKAEVHDTFLAGMARTDFRWINGPRFQLYSGLAIGGGYIGSHEADGSNSNTTVTWAFQLNALGFRFGHDFGVFAEAGFGWNGLLDAGLSGRF